jgi:hypothetical protein
VVDALSRKRQPEVLVLAALSVCRPMWLQQVVDGYSSDPVAVKLKAALALSSGDVNSQFSLDEEVIRHKGRIWLGNNSALHLKIFSASHSSSLGGHSGVTITYKRIKQLFSWPGMKKMLKDWVQSCYVCQQAKPERVKNPGLLKPLPVPQRP